ncbi:hypothetical protein BUUB107078_29360 [Burkholderia ubonensis]|nr:hypothetical protein BUB20358_06662 [Burkholderia ubonensis]
MRVRRRLRQPSPSGLPERTWSPQASRAQPRPMSRAGRTATAWLASRTEARVQSKRPGQSARVLRSSAGRQARKSTRLRWTAPTVVSWHLRLPVGWLRRTALLHLRRANSSRLTKRARRSRRAPAPQPVMRATASASRQVRSPRKRGDLRRQSRTSLRDRYRPGPWSLQPQRPRALPVRWRTRRPLRQVTARPRRAYRSVAPSCRTRAVA